MFASRSMQLHGPDVDESLTDWTRPEYARFLHYAYATQMLELLQSPTFRASFKNEGMAAEVTRRLLQHWSTWRDVPSSTTAAQSHTNGDPPSVPTVVHHPAPET